MTRWIAAALLVGLSAGPAAAQTAIEKARTLYASAAYEDALAELGPASLPPEDVEAAQYRVLCLLALERTADAEAVIEALLQAKPEFAPNPEDTPPRAVEVYARARRRVLPELARRMYVDAKAAFTANDRARAIDAFGGLVALLEHVGGADETLSELRLLAAGFLDLSKALPAPAEPKVDEEVQAEPEPAKPPEIVKPVPISQDLPRWIPGDAMSRQSEFTGVVRIQISETGSVLAAEMVNAIHPAYDRVLLDAARKWTYRPALRDGVPVPSEHLVEVKLRPRE
jgi:TonB family protein